MNTFDLAGTEAKPFIAISIDLCGSTHIKQRIVELAQGDRAARERMFAAYKRLLFDIERTFYFLVLEESELDFGRLTLIKSIGDELWYAYAIDEVRTEDEIRAVRRLLVNLLHLISTDRTLALSGDGLHRANSGACFELPLKIYADIVYQCEELNRERYEHLKEVVACARGLSSAVIAEDDGYLETCHRLNLYVPQRPDDRRRRLPAREDFIGLEVDRFFRLAKHCHARLLTVGQALFDYLGCAMRPAAPEYEHLDIKTIELEAGAGIPMSASEQVFAIRSTVSNSEMKGISDDYSIVHLFDLPSLGDHFAAPSPLVESNMDETRGYLAAKGLFAVIGQGQAAPM